MSGSHSYVPPMLHISWVYPIPIPTAHPYTRFEMASVPFRLWLMRILYRHALDVMEKQGVYLRPLSLDDALASAGLVGPERHLGQVDPQEQVAEWEAANRGKVRQDVTQLRELEASESIISPLVRPQLPPLAGLVIALRRLLEGKTSVEREREEACSHQPVLERILRKGVLASAFSTVCALTKRKS